MSKLAIDGGSPAITSLSSPRLLIGQEERDAAMALFDRVIAGGGAFDRYGGQEVDAYEREFAAFCGTAFATATSSGTAAIHAAIGALRLEPGDEIVSAPITDPGAISPVLMQNCIPTFADTEPETFNMTADGIERVLTDRTRAIVVGHIAGEPADMDPIMELATSRDLVVIEDCSQAHAAEYRGRMVGSIGHMGAFSTMSGKHHTTGGQGGVVTTNNEELYWNTKRFADRGKPFGSDAGENLFMGLNYRMTELAACIGRVQLTKLPGIAASRRTFVDRLQRGLADRKSVRLGKIVDGAAPTYWFGRLRVDESALTVDKAQFAKALAAEGVPCGVTYVTVMYKQTWIANRQAYGRSGHPWTASYAREVDYADCCPNAEHALATHMILHWHENLATADADLILEAIAKVEQAYRR
jgi:dTDP-4-amino-4,6-dideoxygalactose transaminase